MSGKAINKRSLDDQPNGAISLLAAFSSSIELFQLNALESYEKLTYQFLFFYDLNEFFSFQFSEKVCARKT